MSARPASAPGQPILLIVEDLDDPRVSVSSPIRVEVYWEPEGVTVYHPESDVFGYGKDEADALDDFRAALAELFVTLDNDRVSLGPALQGSLRVDRKSTRLNSSHLVISYAVFCLKKKNNIETTGRHQDLLHPNARSWSH